MDSNIPHKAFKAFQLIVKDGRMSHRERNMNVTYDYPEWSYLKPYERTAWYEVVKAVLDAVTPRSC